MYVGVIITHYFRANNERDEIKEEKKQKTDGDDGYRIVKGENGLLNRYDQSDIVICGNGECGRPCYYQFMIYNEETNKYYCADCDEEGLLGTEDDDDDSDDDAYEEERIASYPRRRIGSPNLQDMQEKGEKENKKNDKELSQKNNTNGYETESSRPDSDDDDESSSDSGSSYEIDGLDTSVSDVENNENWLNSTQMGNGVNETEKERKNQVNQVNDEKTESNQDMQSFPLTRKERIRQSVEGFNANVNNGKKYGKTIAENKKGLVESNGKDYVYETLPLQNEMNNQNYNYNNMKVNDNLNFVDINRFYHQQKQEYMIQSNEPGGAVQTEYQPYKFMPNGHNENNVNNVNFPHIGVNDDNETDEKKEKINDENGTNKSVLAFQLTNVVDPAYRETSKKETTPIRAKINHFIETCDNHRNPNQHREKLRQEARKEFEESGLNGDILRSLNESFVQRQTTFFSFLLFFLNQNKKHQKIKAKQYKHGNENTTK